jgi:outer membrane receptor protein involved in Fe transport
MKVSVKLVLILLMTLMSLVYAGTTGKISGKIVDAESGDGLPGVNVVIEGTTLGAATNVNGDYFIIGVPPALYSISARMIGYQTLSYEQVKVSIDKTTSLNFKLNQMVLDVGESVTIVATRPIVERDLTSTSTTISSDMIARMPVETLQDIVNLQAGVVDGHFRGGRSGEVVYMIDGISLNDVYSGDNALQVENNAIQELQVISGTFNAEYGQAMSGVVNVVTKEGGSDYHGAASAYLGNHLTANDDIWGKSQSFSPTANFDGSLNGPVPLLGDKVTFFASGRYYDSQGSIYGKDIFAPSDSSNFPSNDVRDWYIESQGVGHRFDSQESFDHFADSLVSDADFVSMNPSQRYTGQLKLTYKPNGSNKIDYEGLFQHKRFKEYDHNFRYNPDGDYWRNQQSWNNSLNWTNVISQRTFFTLKVSRFNAEYKQHVHEDPYDSSYQNPMLLEAASGSAFKTGGQKMWHFNRNTTTSLGRLDVTSQINQSHQIKMGAEVRAHELSLRAFEIRLNRDTNWQPFIPEQTKNVQNNDEYLVKPLEFSAYIQDKIELEYMVVNAGIRYDYFSSDGNKPDDYLNPSRANLLDVGTTSQISPRFGLSYPITDKGAIHVSYGHFFQIPNFEFLYTNPDYELYPTNDYGSTSPPERQPNTIGNAELKPQKTTIYEIGLQQQIGADLSLDVTAYFKDIRNLLGTEILHSITGIRYARYINRDYGNVKGLTVSLEKQVTGGFGATVDYTYQIAKGNASDPSSAFLDVQAGREPQKQIVPLDWDRTHSLNVSATIGNPQYHSLSIIGKLGTGLPYTPTEQNIRTAVENSERKPMYFNVDLSAYKNLKLASRQFTIFVRVFNLFDRLNENNVYSDTGRANYSITGARTGTIFGVNSLDEYLTRPDFYSSPRQVISGISFYF